MTIPFFPPDLFEEDRDVILEIVHEIGTSADQKFILGQKTVELETAIQQMTRATDVVACGSGTGALTLAVAALGIGPGDEVIVPAFCCQPVASTVANIGATPVFADIEPDTMVIQPSEIEELMSPRTKAVMPAHVFSVMADMPAIQKIAERHEIKVIEDSAVAQGAMLEGRPAGLWGDIGVFSFFQVKVLGTIGEGGVVLTDSPELGAVCRRLRNHGQDPSRRFVHEVVGYNSRFDEIIASFQLYRLRRFEERLARRAQIAAFYTERLGGLRDKGVVVPPTGTDGRCYYVYSLLVERREDLRSYLAAQEIGTHVYYPRPLPRQPAFADFADPAREYRNAQLASDHNLAIPIFPHLTDAEVERIAETISGFYE